MYWIIYATVLALVCVVTEGSVDISFSENGIIRQGDELTITCSIQPKQFRMFELLTLKRDVGGKTFDVATNGALVADFSGQGFERYSVVDGDANLQQGVQVVKISGILGGDRGKWICSHTDIEKNEETATEEIKVVVPPTSLTLQQMNHQGDYVNVQDGETLVFSEEQQSGVQCVVVVNGSNMVPKVVIKIGDSDVTASFTQDELVVAELENGIYKEKITVTYTGYEEPSREDTGKQLTCTASAKDHSEELTKSVTLEVQYAPSLSCKEEWMAEQGSDMKLTCTSSMMPTYDKATWTVATEELSPDQNSADGNFHFMTEANGQEYTFTLHITEVRAQDFAEYTLTVSNAQGADSATVQLQEVVEPETPTPAPTTTTVKTTNQQGGTGEVSDNGAAHVRGLGLLSLLVLTTACSLL